MSTFILLPLSQDGRSQLVNLTHLESVKDVKVGMNAARYTRYRTTSGEVIESTKSLDDFVKEINGEWNPTATVE